MLFFLSIDQATKYIAVQNAVFQLNTGISFNLFSEMSSRYLTLIQLTTVVIVWLLFKKMWSEHVVIFALLFSGAISNLVDRLIYNGVVDWIFLPVIDLKNNLADMYIFLAVVGVCFFSIKDSHHGKAKDETRT